jgi:hypothetical protein
MLQMYGPLFVVYLNITLNAKMQWMGQVKWSIFWEYLNIISKVKMQQVRYLDAVLFGVYLF